MLPAHLAENIRNQVLHYLQSTFTLRDPAVERAFEQFLTDPENGVFKGPWAELKLPFRLAVEGEVTLVTSDGLRVAAFRNAPWEADDNSRREIGRKHVSLRRRRYTPQPRVAALRGAPWVHGLPIAHRSSRR